MVNEEVTEIAVLHDVVLAFGAEEGFAASDGFGAAVNEVLPFDDFGTDEAFDEISVDDTGGFGGFGAYRDGPGAGFVSASGKEALEAKELVGGTDELGKPSFIHAEGLEVFGLFFGGEACYFIF